MYKQIINELEPFYIKEIIPTEIIKEEKKECKKKEFDFFIPYEKDTLFWCFYIFKNGIANYEMLENRNIVKEKDEKIKYIEKIRKNKALLKQNKIKLIPQIESNLLNDEIIDLKTFHVLCLLENINYLLIEEHFYFENKKEEEEKIFILKKKKKDVYSYQIKDNQEKENKFEKVEIDKNFYCISHYSLKDLKEICIKLKIEIQKEWKKKDIYDYLITLS